MTDDRSAFIEARDVGLRQRHEQRLDRATYTAAEVRVLTDAALLLGRREAAEEIAAAIDARSNDGTWNMGGQIVFTTAARIARDIAKGDPT